jgi:predicted ATPase/DNA-binding SARP family transcriptional activator
MTIGPWTLRLLGAFDLSDGQQQHSKLITRAAMALLARLCLRPTNAHPREELVELLWPGAEPEAGRQRLRQTLSTLRQVLEPATRPGMQVIAADRLSLRLAPGSVLCDAVAFEQAYQRGEHDQARALYRGELLPGFFDEWISDERLRLEGLFDRLRAPVVPPPAPPAAAAATATPEGARQATLPSYMTQMVGADPQVQSVRDEVTAHRLVTLMGPGGTGKTRLAVEVAQALTAASVFEFVTFVPLATCRTRQALLDQLLMSLRLGDGKAGAMASLVQALDGRRTLLVLDNFEQLVDEGAEAVAELVAALPLLHLLVTSRRGLDLPAERELLAAALALPADDAPLAAALDSPAVRLLVERARAVRADFSVNDGNLAVVIALVRLLDGMPLAIELAAARLRSMAPAEMVDTLREARAGKASALDLLARPAQRGRQDTRHHSMQETIAWSWRLLSDDLRAVLSGLTVFQGGFSTEAARAVCLGSQTSPGKAWPAAGQLRWSLDELLSHSLLRAEQRDDSTRFNLYEPIREFAQRALAPEELAELRQRHGSWALAWVQALPVTPSLAAVQTEMPNLVAAMQRAVDDGRADLAIQITVALQPVLEDITLPSAGVAALEAAVAQSTNQALKSRGLTALGRLHFRSGRGSASLALVDEGLALAPLDQAELRSRALLMAAHAALNRGQRGAPVLALLDEAQALSEGIGDQSGLARIDSCRADVVRASSLQEAEALQRRALATWEARGDRIGAMRVRYSLAILAFHCGRYDAMCSEIDPVIAEARRAQAWLRLSASLNVRGVALTALRRWDEAAAALRDSVRVAWQALAPLETLYAVVSLPYLLLRKGQPEAALQLAGYFVADWQRRFGALRADQQADVRRVQRIARRMLGEARTAACLAQGQALTAAQALALALDDKR